jgi:exodeoxyribonuclease V alpha subunit
MTRRTRQVALVPPATREGSDSLRGTVERITYRSEESGYVVLRLAVAGEREPIAVVGNLGAAEPGEELWVEGHWVRDPRYGPQFKAVACRSAIPSTLAGLRKYLGSGLIRGIGKALAGRIVQRFGETTVDVLDGTPDRLSEVAGIGPKRVEAVRRAWAEQRAVKDVMILLQSHGVSPLLAHRIWRTYRENAIDVLHRDPYRLAHDIRGVGFKTADRIAGDLGIPRDAPARADAALIHLLGAASDEGHVWVDADELLARMREELEIPEAPAGRALADAVRHLRIAAEPSREDPREVALASLDACERAAAAALRRIVRTPPRLVPIDAERAVLWYQSTASIELAPQQREAILRALRDKVLVVTGGPGTGKTTLLRGVLAVLARKRVRTALAAPTGRAAKRMTEATGVEARTIHRLLEYDPRRGGFLRGPDRPIEADLVVIDEASMLDTVLAHRLLAAIHPASRLVLVGDIDQLPSVGPGHVLGDVIVSERVPVVRLTEVFRQAASSLIVRNAHGIRRGVFPVSPRDKTADFYFIEEEPEKVTERVVRLVAEDLPRRRGVDPFTDVQVLCPMNRGRAGTAEINEALQARLNPDGAEVRQGWKRIRVGDRVMQTANDYDRDVFNGDLGRVVSVRPGDRDVLVEFDGRTVPYTTADLDDLTLAYACSIHKSQGSEYPVVVVPLVPAHWVMLARNLLYTAVTRGKRLVLLVGSRRALGRAVSNDRPVHRRTRLAQRIRDAFDEGAAPPVDAGAIL